MRLKHLFIIYIIGVLTLGPLAVAVPWQWSGQLGVGESLVVAPQSGPLIHIIIDRNIKDNRTVAVIKYPGGTVITYNSTDLEGLHISILEWKGQALLSISSEQPFSVYFNSSDAEQLASLQAENEQLKAQLANATQQVKTLQAQVKSLKAENEQLKQKLQKAHPEQIQQLQTQITNLTKENRELKAQLANQTKQINQLQAENDFLKSQVDEYKGLLAKVMEQESEKARHSYIEQAAKKEKLGKVLLGALTVGAIFAGLVVWLGKRAEARYKRLV